MKIFVIRHGETDLNKAKILQGQTEDGNLNEAGIAQAHASLEFLPKDISIIFASPLKRAKQTAEIIAQYLHSEGGVLFRDELKEKHYGSLSGKTWEEVEKTTGRNL